jgi:lysozyme
LTTEFLIEDLKRDEGLRLTAYPDPLSGAEPYTIGYGHTGPEVHLDLVWSEEQCNTVLQDDIARAERALDADMPWWRSMCDPRQDALANMCFNMGVGRLSGFHHALAAMQARNYDEAATQMEESAWAKELGDRATRLAALMRTGDRPTP